MLVLTRAVGDRVVVMDRDIEITVVYIAPLSAVFALTDRPDPVTLKTGEFVDILPGARMGLGLIDGRRVRLLFDAPQDVRFMRKELLHARS